MSTRLLLRDIQASAISIVPELLFSGAVLVEDNLVGSPNGLSGEQAVHALKRDTLGFGDEEVGVDKGKGAEGAPDEEYVGAEVAFVGVDL